MRQLIQGSNSRHFTHIQRIQKSAQLRESLQKEVSNEQLLEREIQDNIRLRECRKSIEERMRQESSIRSQLDREYQSHTTKQLTHPGEGFQHMSKTFADLDKQRERLVSEQASIRGGKNALEQQAAVSCDALYASHLQGRGCGNGVIFDEGH